MIAVKPPIVSGVLGDIAKGLDVRGNCGQIVVSVAAGVTLTALQTPLPSGTAVVRAMPNTLMLVGQGMSALAAGAATSAAQLEQVAEIMRAVGTVVTVDKSQLAAVTAVSGSGPTYVFLVAEAPIEAGVGLGLTRDVVTELVELTLLGSSALLSGSDKSLAALRAEVTTPGGITAAAMREAGAGGCVFGVPRGPARRRAAGARTGPGADQVRTPTPFRC